MMSDSVKTSCYGCSALVAACETQPHPYIGASPGCWRVYTDLLGKLHAAPVDALTTRLAVDAYAAQHPGVEGPQQIRSVAGHLIALHLVLERNAESEFATRCLGRLSELRDRLVWLDPPTLGGLTVVDVAARHDMHIRAGIVREWATNVWDSRRKHHNRIRDWAIVLAPTT
ncbi:MAG: hypothetical protein IPK69_12680 [Phycisphaerales bacterium]|nr:MAG: hypothetical protein IPK69_12680 [Phycisphaerales bacterium]